MCRHLAYLGPPVSLAELLLEPEHGLLTQSWAPRRQRYGTVNADGFGVGWYADGDPRPARYRRAVPMWTDPSFTDVARVTRSGAVLAAVRSATVGTTADESAAAPYTAGPWLFSHNGVVHGWPDEVDGLVAGAAPSRLLRLEAPGDSALLWALTLDRLEAGDTTAAALTAVLERVHSVTTGRFNLLLTDGVSLAATADGDTLFWRGDPAGGVVVASEPSDDGAGWHDVPDGSLLTVDDDGVVVRPLPSTKERPAAS
jgi:glutamine amidotransferase